MWLVTQKDNAQAKLLSRDDAFNHLMGEVTMRMQSGTAEEQQHALTRLANAAGYWINEVDLQQQPPPVATKPVVFQRSVRYNKPVAA